MSDNLFEAMFKHAESVAMEEFTDEDVEAEGIEVPELDEGQLAQEGLTTAVLSDIFRSIPEAYRQIKGWFEGIAAKKKHINDNCVETIEWLKDEDRSNPKLSLDMGSFKTFCKTSETFYWRYYFVLNDEIYNEIMKSIKNNEITAVEVLTDFTMRDRMKVTRMIDSAQHIKDLIVIMEKYRSRVNAIFDGLVKRKRTIQNFPFQVMLLGYNDLNKTCKKVVNLAT